MIGSSKILTVSYGTFSCTLEGFDEPFSTMKAIAEYFRDLAAEDRYFGAVPPTPDAEMLHRIAEREIHRRVEARVDERGIVLRQADAAPAPVTQPAPMAQPVPQPTVAEAPATAAIAAPAVAAAEVAEAPAIEEAVAEEPVAETVAAEVGESASTEIAAEAPVTEEAVTEVPVVAEAVTEEPASEEIAAKEPVADADDVYDISLEAVMEEAAVEPVTDVEADEALPEIEAEAEEPETDSIAAKLMRIRAVVEGARASRVADYEEEVAEEQPLAASMPEDFGFALDLSDDVPELRAAEEARAAAREVVAEAPETAVDSDDTEDLAGSDADIVAEDWIEEPEVAEVEPEETQAEPEPVAAAADEAEPFADAAADDDGLMARLSQLSAESHADVQPAAEAAAVAEPVLEEEAEQDDALAAFLAEEEVQHADAEPVEEAPSLFQRARARVIRLSRAAIGAPVDQDLPEPEAAALIVPPLPVAEPVAEAVAEPVAADLEPEFEPEAESADDEFETAAQEPSEARALLEASADEDSDVERLMEEAKSKLEGAESRRRFSAISHLKAAVAATLADRQMQDVEQPMEAKAEQDAPYRDDLSKAVRPRRPAAEGATTRRPTTEIRPAPLVLVSEQRVDRVDGAIRDGAVVRPRRIAAGNLAVHVEEEEDIEDLDTLSPEDVSSFAEFCERVGAASLTELLEAAAVYTASVEGRTHFSRPQLLRKVEFVSSRADFSREDSLRSFGMLLRQGKIQKVSPGQFTVTDSSKFMTEARKDD